jgi:hypothetical protein
MGSKLAEKHSNLGSRTVTLVLTLKKIQNIGGKAGFMGFKT